MKIAFIIPINGISGGLYVVYRHAHFLASVGNEVEILISNPARGTQVSCYPGFDLPTRLLEDAVSTGREYDVTVATWWETFYEMFQVKSNHRVYFCQSDERRFYANQRSLEVSLVDLTYRDPQIGFITEARWIQSWLKEEFNISAQYAPNGIDLTLFHPQVKPLAPRGGRVRILIEGPGSLFFKRIDLAFQVTQRFSDIDVWYVSSDGFTEPHWKFSRMFSCLSLQDMPAIYASCDILLKLSSVEGFFGPPLEMMACGGTAVVAKATGWDEYIRPGGNALAVPIDDAEAAYRALRLLIDDSSLRAKLSSAGLMTAQHLSWEVQCSKFEEGFRKLVSKENQAITNESSYRLILQQRKHILSLEERLRTRERWLPFRVWKKAGKTMNRLKQLLPVSA